MVFEKFTSVLSDAARLLKGLATPSSGQKRRREHSENLEDQRRSKALATGQVQPKANAVDLTEPAPKASVPPVSQSFDPLGAVRKPAASVGTPFVMGERVREMRPGDGGTQAQYPETMPQNGQLHDQQRRHGAAGLGLGGARVGEVHRYPEPAAAQRGDPTIAPTGVNVYGRPSASSGLQQPQPVASIPAPLVPQHRTGAGAGAPPLPAERFPVSTPAPASSQGYGATATANNNNLARQLFSTPSTTGAAMPSPGGTTLNKLRGLNIGGDSAPRPAPPPPPPAGGVGYNTSYASAAGAGAGSAAFGAAGARAPNWVPPWPGGYRQPTANMGAGACRQGYPSYLGRPAPPPSYAPRPPPAPSPFLQPQPSYGRVPFNYRYVQGVRDLSTDFTADHLRALLQTVELQQANLLRPVPSREDGGFIPDDSDSADQKVATTGQEAQAAQQRLRSLLSSVVKASSCSRYPDAVSAASGAAAARATLAVGQAVAGREAVTAVQNKIAAHEQEVQRVRREAEENTRQQVEAVKSVTNSQRTQAEQQLRAQEERLRRASQPLPPAFGAAAPTATAAAAAGVAGPAGAMARGRPPSAPATAPPPQAMAAGPSGSAPPSHGSLRPAPARRPAPSPKEEDDEVVDLISSSDEEEAEAQGAEQEDEEMGEVEEDDDVVEVEEEEEDDEAKYGKYGVPYGQYGNEARGGGNRALRSPTLTAAERANWRRTMDRMAALAEILLAFNPNLTTDIQLAREKLQCMDVSTWLNDEVINLYMLLLQERDTRLRNIPAPAGPSGSARGGGGDGRPPRCHFFSSFFYNKLFQDDGAYNYANVRRWTLAKRLPLVLQASDNVLELDRIIMPVHKGVHWVCAEIDLKEKVVRYYDSLKGEDRQLVKHLLQWVSDESHDKLKQRWDTSNWRVEFPKNIPQQTNGCDCGVFSVMFADCLGAGRPMNFTQAEMDLLRIKVLHRLMTKRVD